VAALLDALAAISTQHGSAVGQLEMRRKRLEDLTLELARPFEHEARLVDLLARQRELAKRLDLDKSEAGSAHMDAEAAPLAA
jgi:hypothetical protein